MKIITFKKSKFSCVLFVVLVLTGISFLSLFILDEMKNGKPLPEIKMPVKEIPAPPTLEEFLAKLSKYKPGAGYMGIEEKPSGTMGYFIEHIDDGTEGWVEGGVEGGIEGGVVGGVLGAPLPPTIFEGDCSIGGSGGICTRGTPGVPRRRGKEIPKIFMHTRVSHHMLSLCLGYFNTEEYDRIYENRFLASVNNPLSTFSIDVDNASYTNMRRFIKGSQMPPKDSVRIEEFINYFDYDYPEPIDQHPFSINTEIAPCPWNTSHDLLHIGLRGKKMKSKELPPANLVFLLDVSGSMRSLDKLPLLKASFKLLVKNTASKDRISIVVYAGAAGLVLPCTTGDQKKKIIEAIDNLEAGGSTAGGAGIKLAYKIAADNFIPSGNNRVILATDGDFNVGVSSTSELTRMIEKSRETGIFLTVLGFGIRNYKDHRMEQLADKGNGNYYYIDSILEGKKVFVDEMRATLFTIAKDVKIQVEFNPARVKAYRLIGYENRMLKKEDFNDDKKDAGELGSGHRVTALYEIVPTGAKEETAAVDDLKYQETSIKKEAFESKEIVTVKLRYKEPDGEKSKLIVRPVTKTGITELSGNFLFSAAVAQFAMLLRDSGYKGVSSFDNVLKLAKASKGGDPYGYRSEFINLVEMSKLLYGQLADARKSK